MNQTPDYDTPRHIKWGVWGAAAAVVFIYAIVIVVSFYFRVNPHDWDCSRHGGVVPMYGTKTVICKDGYTVSS